MKPIKRIHLLLLVLALVLMALPFKKKIRQALSPLGHAVDGRATVADRVRQYGAAARERMRPHFDAAGVRYPPAEIALVGLKDEEVLEVWARNEAGVRFSRIRTYPILGTSGRLGPKLREGDMQIPEGIYAIESLNPNSAFHLSLRLNYPNAFDLKHASGDGRNSPGSDIMIHGADCSVGCLAMGDPVAEDLFVLAADTGLRNIKVILAPVDLRIREFPRMPDAIPAWLDELYATIRGELKPLTLGKE